MKIIVNKFYGVTTKGILHTFIESYSQFSYYFFVKLELFIAIKILNWHKMDAILSKINNNLMIENVDNTAINDIVQQVREYWKYFNNVDWDNIDYYGILKAINQAKFLKAKFNDERTYAIMKKLWCIGMMKFAYLSRQILKNQVL